MRHRARLLCPGLLAAGTPPTKAPVPPAPSGAQQATSAPHGASDPTPPGTTTSTSASAFTRQRQLGRLALSSDASVPADALRNAQLQRRTMLKVLEHWFDDDPEIAAELAVVREGAGYQDLVNDLEALADLYQRQSAR